ncbi:hypothetical protein EWM62_09670 [Mucilaginibacter terrigena]|uniref:Uncharacterized protein n=1 Tax=Mucilaginibacter terrigena TaxID=2492395 RepID=A0A4Q5LMJ0_9SPHI|nr:hypothetical protein [Mucilaginibacter terrigena]RYU90896.1 hypothetical protein EWM62_09670 [Mucilaginibacter terrigena]
MKRINYIFIIAIILLGACKKDPSEGIQSHERAIEAVTLGEGLVQVGPAVVDRANSKVTVRVLMQNGTTFENVKANIQTSYKSSVAPESGSPIDFAAHDNQATYTVTAETGEKRDWTVELVPFTEPLLGTFNVQSLVVYGGTGPEYGGGGVVKMTDKPWAWPAVGGPEAEQDNTLTFVYTGVTADGNTTGTVTNNAGADGKYADFKYILNPPTDVNNFYRTIPKGEGTWIHDYNANKVIFKSADGTTTTATFVSPGTTTDLGNGKSRTVTDNSFMFTLNGTDDWNNIYSDYDKFVKHPRVYWIDVKKQ